MNPPCTRMYTHPFFVATPPGAAPGPRLKPGPVFVTSGGVINRDINPGYVGAVHCCKAPLWGGRLDLGRYQVRNYSPGYMEQAKSRGHEASPQSGLGMGCKLLSSSKKNCIH